MYIIYSSLLVKYRVQRLFHLLKNQSFDKTITNRLFFQKPNKMGFVLGSSFRNWNISISCGSVQNYCKVLHKDEYLPFFPHMPTIMLIGNRLQIADEWQLTFRSARLVMEINFELKLWRSERQTFYENGNERSNRFFAFISI